MFNSIVDTFISLDDNKQNKILDIVLKFINPIKIYLIVVILLLLIMCISNYYINIQLSKVLNME